MGQTLGLPLRCPKCPSKHYFGVLKGQLHLTEIVRPGKDDVCPNCDTALVPVVRGARADQKAS